MATYDIITSQYETLQYSNYCFNVLYEMVKYSECWLYERRHQLKYCMYQSDKRQTAVPKTVKYLKYPQHLTTKYLKCGEYLQYTTPKYRKYTQYSQYIPSKYCEYTKYLQYFFSEILYSPVLEHS